MDTSDPLASFQVPGTTFGYTGIQVDELQSSTNTIAVALMDESGSTDEFKNELEQCCKTIVAALRDSTVADNLIYRQCHFGTSFREQMGFTELMKINVDVFNNCYHPGGSTHLYDSCDQVIREIGDYAKKHTALRYTVNGILFVMTDGRDYGSVLKQKDVKKALVDVMAEEDLESLMTILIGINPDSTIQAELEAFAKNIGFTKYIPLVTTDKKSLKDSLDKVSQHLSQQIVAQSQVVGSGSMSQSLTF